MSGFSENSNLYYGQEMGTPGGRLRELALDNLIGAKVGNILGMFVKMYICL